MSKSNGGPALPTKKTTKDVAKINSAYKSSPIKTLLLKKTDLELAAKMLREGKLVAFPTETVYGLGADALNPEAVNKTYDAKGRPRDNPLIVHVSSIAEVTPLVKKIPARAKKLIDAFWPGPLSIVFEKSSLVPRETTAGLDTVVIRMPNHELAVKLIALAKTPIAAPSANSSGKPSPTKAEHVAEDLFGKIDAILDGGSCKEGLESTVIDVRTNPCTVLRLGSITLEELEKVLGKVQLAAHGTKAASPGMKYRHYAPAGKLILVRGPAKSVDEKIQQLFTKYPDAQILKRTDIQASKLFSALRISNSKIILCPSIPKTGLGRTIMDRLERAAAEIIDVE